MSKKGGHPKGKGPSKPTTTVVVDAAPLETFLISLFEQAEARVVKADQRANKETVKKLAAALKAVAVDITSNPRSAGLHKHALRAVMSLSGAGYGSVPINRKIVSIFFAVLIDELRTNWKEYGFKETEVHPDYHVEFETFSKKDGLTYYWDAPDIDGADLAEWDRAWEFLSASV